MPRWDRVPFFYNYKNIVYENWEGEKRAGRQADRQAGRQADRQATHIHRGANLHTRIHARRVDRDSGVPRSLRLPFASVYLYVVLLFLYFFCKVDR